jgi:hypothetical protein
MELASRTISTEGPRRDDSNQGLSFEPRTHTHTILSPAADAPWGGAREMPMICFVGHVLSSKSIDIAKQ